MILRMLILVLGLVVPLTAIQETSKADASRNLILLNNHENFPKTQLREDYITGCDVCRGGQSGAESLQMLKKMLNEGLFSLPQVRPLVANEIIIPNLSNPKVIKELASVIEANGIGGPTGPAGGVLDFADFFALMPPDNAATVAPGTDVSFPQEGPTSSGTITRTGPSTFNLAEIGVYQVLFQVSVTEGGQLILTLNGADLAYTVVGRETGTSQIVGMAIVQTTVINSILTVRNPAGNSTALTITPLAGGTRPVSAHLVITQIQ